MSVNVSLIMLIMLFIETVEPIRLGREYYSCLISVFNDGIIHVTVEIFYLKRLNVRRFGKTGARLLSVFNQVDLFLTCKGIVICSKP